MFHRVLVTLVTMVLVVQVVTMVTTDSGWWLPWKQWLVVAMVTCDCNDAVVVCIRVG